MRAGVHAEVQNKQAVMEMTLEPMEQQGIQPMDGSAVLIQGLKDQGVEVIFGYPGVPSYQFTTHYTRIRFHMCLPVMNRAQSMRRKDTPGYPEKRESSLRHRVRVPRIL